MKAVPKKIDYGDKRIGPGCPPLMITPQVAAEITGLSYKQILALCKAGEIVHERSNYRFKINRIALIEYLSTAGLARRE